MRSRAAGFTLLEMVLAMVALALISAICYGAFFVAIRAVERGEVAVVTAQRLRAMSDVFTRQIRAVVPFPRAIDGFFETVDFEGHPDSLTFVTAAAQLGGGGLARVTYKLLDDPPRLVLVEEPFFSAQPTAEPTDEPLLTRTAVLLEGMERVEFSYFDSDGGDDPGQWCRSWDSVGGEGFDDCDYDPDGRVPRAVRLMITGVPGLDVPQWGQETPLAVANYYDDANREFSELELLEQDDIEDLSDAADEDEGDDEEEDF